MKVYIVMDEWCVGVVKVFDSAPLAAKWIAEAEFPEDYATIEHEVLDSVAASRARGKRT